MNRSDKKIKLLTDPVWAGSIAVIAVLIIISFLWFGWGLSFVLVPVAAAAIFAYRMHVHRLGQKTREISEASRIHLATVEALATAIDAREQVGAGHVRRTQIYAVGIGRLFGLPEPEIDALRAGALLHDIGKLAIPDHILNKPGELTAGEMEKTKIHAAVGASILDKVGFNCPVVPAVRHHHECWDGSGYPDGLKGTDIPIAARILAAADAFDTIRAARPYRPARSRDTARQIMQAEAGTRFDPTVVDTLLRNLTALESEVVAAGFDYTEEEVAHDTGGYVEQIMLANREVFSLYELALEFSTAVGRDDTLSMFAKKVAEFVPFTTCVVYLLDSSKRFANAAHAEGANADLLRSRRIKTGQGATGFVLKSGEIAQNVDPDLDMAYIRSELAEKYWVMTSAPLTANGEILGAVSLYSDNLEQYGEEHIRLLETISNIASDAIRKSLKHDEATTHALTDPMTGLPNARSLQIEFDKEAGRASRTGTKFQLLMLDLDGFKAVNDSYGHKAGDEMLREVGAVIRTQLREYDFLARYGGDEFVALVPDTSQSDVSELCERIEKAVCEFKLGLSGERTTSVGVSLGAATYPEHGETLDHLVIAADRVMYQRKAYRKRHLLTRNLERIAQEDHKVAVPALPETLIVELDESHIVASAAVN